MFEASPDLLTFVAAAPVTAAPLSKRDAIKVAGGEAYAALLAKERVARAKFRERHPERVKVERKNRRRPFKTHLVNRARLRGRKRGIEATITVADLIWPTHCPVLGLELEYPARCGMRVGLPAQANWPTLDRWDNAKGYVPGNVFVISMRANALKSDATYAEFLAIARYMARKPRHDG